MISISDSPYLVEHEINSNDSKLASIVKGLIMTTEVPSSQLIDEKLLCFIVSKEARPIAIGITILDDKTLYIDNICFYPGFNEDCSGACVDGASLVSVTATTSSSFGSGFFSNKFFAATRIPGVQIPHCKAACSTNFF